MLPFSILSMLVFSFTIYGMAGLRHDVAALFEHGLMATLAYLIASQVRVQYRPLSTVSTVLPGVPPGPEVILCRAASTFFLAQETSSGSPPVPACGGLLCAHWPAGPLPLPSCCVQVLYLAAVATPNQDMAFMVRPRTWHRQELLASCRDP